MIKVDAKRTTIKGKTSDVLQDFEHTIEGVLNALCEVGAPREEAVKIMQKTFEIALLTKEEAKARWEEIQREKGGAVNGAEQTQHNR